MTGMQRRGILERVTEVTMHGIYRRLRLGL